MASGSRLRPVQAGISMLRAALLGAYEALYGAGRLFIFRASAQGAHEQALRLLRGLDGSTRAQALLRLVQQLAFAQQPVMVGGVRLPHPLILAAGLVKGDSFGGEDIACAAVDAGVNIIPGWRSMPALVGPVEMGSFTRWPRTGNPGTVVWRDVPGRSTQNRVGLKNPGARAAAAFLACHRGDLPPVYGINIAVSPGLNDPAQEQHEALEAVGSFMQQGVIPTWFTLNISCPNTGDDPGSHQTERRARDLCETVITAIDGRAPLWVKISPDLAPGQYQALMRVFAESGVGAVVATNTLAQPAPHQPHRMAGVGGARLHLHALDAATRLMHEKAKHGYTVDVIGCGGIQDALTYHAFARLGIPAVQYWSALIYRGPLAAALIMNEAHHV
jgi:dihydroorotate dehydrogenase